MTWYGLLHEGKLLGFRYESNGDAEFANSTSCVLDTYNDGNVWLVPDRRTAEAAAVTNPPWFNAGWACPENPYVGKCQVVEVTLTVQHTGTYSQD